MNTWCNPTCLTLLGKMLTDIHDWVIVCLIFIHIWVN